MPSTGRAFQPDCSPRSSWRGFVMHASTSAILSTTKRTHAFFLLHNLMKDTNQYNRLSQPPSRYILCISHLVLIFDESIGRWWWRLVWVPFRKLYMAPMMLVTPRERWKYQRYRQRNMSAAIEIDDKSERWSARSTSVTFIAKRHTHQNSKPFWLKTHNNPYTPFWNPRNKYTAFKLTHS